MNTVPNVYIVPLGSHNYWIKPEIENILSLFYHDEDIPFSPNYYEMSLEEVILLDCGDINNTFYVDEYCGNGFLARIKTPSEKDVFILGVMENAHNIWDEVIQKYSIPIECLMDSHKGLGNWFTTVPLYKSMSITKNRELLPKFYF